MTEPFDESWYQRVEAALPKEMRTAKYERMQQWQAEDGWIIGYTTTRVVDSKHDGKFLVVAYRPYGKGSRSGKAKRWKIDYERSFAKRKDARNRAMTLYRQHSPKFNEEHFGGEKS